MAVSSHNDRITGPAASDLTGKMFYAGYVNSSGQIDVATGPNLGLMGIIVETGKAGKEVTLRTDGYEKWVVSASLSPAYGDKLCPDGAGRARARVAAITVTGSNPVAVTTEDILAVSRDKGTTLAVDTLITVKIVNDKN